MKFINFNYDSDNLSNDFSLFLISPLSPNLLSFHNPSSSVCQLLSRYSVDSTVTCVFDKNEIFKVMVMVSVTIGIMTSDKGTSVIETNVIDTSGLETSDKETRNKVTIRWRPSNNLITSIFVVVKLYPLKIIFSILTKNNVFYIFHTFHCSLLLSKLLWITREAWCTTTVVWLPMWYAGGQADKSSENK